METVRFSAMDAELLYSFPKPASDIATIVRCFTFLNRTAPPNYDDLKGCLIRAMKAGVVRKQGGLFAIEDGWYDRIHMADAISENEIEAMLEFESKFLNVDFDVITDADSVLTQDEYHAILAQL